MSQDNKLKVACFRIKLKSGSVKQAHDWAETLNNRAQEFAATLKNVGIRAESVFIETNEEGEFLLLYLRSDDIQAANHAFMASREELSTYTRKFVGETWEAIHQLKPLIIFDNDTDDAG